MNVPIARTSLTESEVESVLEPLRSGWLVQGPKVREFETKWATFTGAEHAIAVTSCTSAMHLSLVALGIGPGDEVVVPAFTWIATANVVEHVGATVVFCDIDLETFNIDVADLATKINARTRAIIPVHLFGLAANMKPLLDLAHSHGLRVIEDAACGFGARYLGAHVGTLGDVGCFSFHPRKAITTGEGGMITTNDGDLATHLRRLRDHGAVSSDLQRHLGPKPYLLADHTDAGFNQRMTDIQGALGSAQMERAGEIVAERVQLAARYDAAFRSVRWLRTPARIEGLQHGYQSYPCLFEPEPIGPESLDRVHRLRNLFMDTLQERGVSTRPATHAVHMLAYYRVTYGIDADDFPRARIANDCSVSLPLFNGMTEEEQGFVVDQVVKFDAGR